MGKKKSVVLMTLLTIVIVVLCAITAFPSFTIPFTNGIKKWNPAVMQFDLGMDIGGEYLDSHVGGGYYAYYYPDGVVPANEYVEEDNDHDHDHGEEYGYEAHGGLYLSKDPDKRIYLEDGSKNPDFQEDFDAAVKAISARYAAKGYEDYRISIVDDYAIRVELPASQASDGFSGAESASQAITMFAATGELSLQQDGTTISELTDKDKDYTINDIIKSVKVKTEYEVSYLEIKFTALGKTVLDNYVTAASTDSSTAGTLSLALGGEAIISITSDIVSGKTVKYYTANQADKQYTQTLCILLNSALENGGHDVEFTVSEVRTFAPVYAKNALYFVFGGLLAVILVLIIAAIVKMGRFGVVNAYSTLSYVIVTALCYAFISGGVFPVTMGTVLVFLMGLVLVNVSSYQVYAAIKAEAMLGKTVESSVKSGYKKTLWGFIDTHAVLLLGSLALLIGVGGLFTVAVQAIIAVITSAFMCLLWGRAINFTFLSASKDKYKYFKFVREDDDDE